MNTINLSSMILPGISAAGYNIGSNLSSCRDLSNAIEIDTSQKSIGQVLSNSQGWMFSKSWSADTNTFYGSNYYYKDNVVRLVFNSNGLLYAIYISDGYQGKAFDSIGVHSNLYDIEELFSMEYDSCEETYYPSNDSGISGIEFYAVKSPTDLDIQDGEILMICIYNWTLR
jgi:hypothetical protein